jgi:hypothetical protein
LPPASTSPSSWASCSDSGPVAIQEALPARSPVDIRSAIAIFDCVRPAKLDSALSLALFSGLAGSLPVGVSAGKPPPFWPRDPCDGATLRSRHRGCLAGTVTASPFGIRRSRLRHGRDFTAAAFRAGGTSIANTDWAMNADTPVTRYIVASCNATSYRTLLLEKPTAETAGTADETDPLVQNQFISGPSLQS